MPNLTQKNEIVGHLSARINLEDNPESIDSFSKKYKEIVVELWGSMEDFLREQQKMKLYRVAELKVIGGKTVIGISSEDYFKWTGSLFDLILKADEVLGSSRNQMLVRIYELCPTLNPVQSKIAASTLTATQDSSFSIKGPSFSPDEPFINMDAFSNFGSPLMSLSLSGVEDSQAPSLASSTATSSRFAPVVSSSSTAVSSTASTLSSSSTAVSSTAPALSSSSTVVSSTASALSSFSIVASSSTALAKSVGSKSKVSTQTKSTQEKKEGYAQGYTPRS